MVDINLSDVSNWKVFDMSWTTTSTWSNYYNRVQWLNNASTTGRITLTDNVA